MLCDFDTDVTAMSTQAFALLWPHHLAQGPQHHIPDLFLRLQDGSGVVVDVRPKEHIDARARDQFNRTEAAAAEAGWVHRVFTGLGEPQVSNLRFLAGYRFDRCRPAPLVQDALLAVFTGCTPRGAGVERVCRDLSAVSDRVLMNTYNLLWRHRLHADLGAPLGMDVEVST